MYFTKYHSQYLSWQLSKKAQSGSIESLGTTLVDAQVDINPHQVEAALFAVKNPLSKGVMLADEVGLGKTIEAGLVLAQFWAERRRKILIITPANLRKQWYQELLDKFAIESLILESKNYNKFLKDGIENPFESDKPIICSYQFAKSKITHVQMIPWDLVVFDEAHRLRNVYKKNNVIANELKRGLSGVKKILLTATPLQNSLLELYGLISVIDERVFGDLDSFRRQYARINNQKVFEDLRDRISPLCKRTLRSQVSHFIRYTKRIPLVQEFNPSEDEQQLRKLVTDYLRRPELKALPSGQRQLISLVLWKLLASSTYAIAGALGTMANRLQDMLDDSKKSESLLESLGDEYEGLDEDVDELGIDEVGAILTDSEKEAIKNEIEELRRYEKLAKSVRDDRKSQPLIEALDNAFKKLKEFGAEQKALIFTESRKTQDYLYEFLNSHGYADEIVLFNGTNDSKKSQEIYKAWLEKHKNSDKITGSKTADIRAALVEYFRDSGKIMIATEAGAEGINLQFCSLVINYDLPWNPQRVEQRIGRCHRYGQKFDVVVVNFVDRSNKADKRVYELLNQKFKLFEGVFGASDEVLGAIGSGVDFEKRIAEIYQQCRTPEEIEEHFDTLQKELEGQIKESMLKTRDILFEHFDEEVLEKLRIESQETRNRYEEMFMQLSRIELGDYAEFVDENGFVLKSYPDNELQKSTQLGKYELPRRSGEAFLYRFGHPLGEYVINKAKNRELPFAKLVFDYEAYEKKISTLEQWRGKSGILEIVLVEVDSLSGKEQELIVSAVTHDGKILPEDDPQKLFKLPVSSETTLLNIEQDKNLKENIEQRKKELISNIGKRNLEYFEQEVRKLDDWADDLKVGLEQEIKELDREIKEIRRSASSAKTLEEKLHFQKLQTEIEQKRNRMRRDLFDRQDEIEEKRNTIIAELEEKLHEKVQEKMLFRIEWELR